MEKWVGAGELAELSGVFQPAIVPPPVPVQASTKEAGANFATWFWRVAAVGSFVVMVWVAWWKLSQPKDNPEPVPIVNPTGPVVNQDSLDNAKMLEDEQQIRAEAEKKARESQEWRNLVVSEMVTATSLNTFGGFEYVTFKVTNNLSYEVKWLVVELQYTLQNGRLYATREVEVMNIKPFESISVVGPGMNRGVKVGSKVKYINVPDLGLDFGSEAYQTKREIGKLFE